MSAPASSPTLVLIDGTNYAFRAFYAMPLMSTSSGLPTNALKGFANMLVHYLEVEKPDFLAVAFDAKGPTFRKLHYGEYKAQRKPPPPELLPQFPYFRRLCEAMRVSFLEVDGFEADDIVATLVRRVRGEALQVKIISVDKDLMQLVDDRVRMVDTLRNVLYDREGVIEKWGVPPEQLRDLLALTGDSSDNVPGVPGIGPKKARDLLGEFGTLDAVLERLGEVRNLKVKEALQANVEQARLSQYLVTLHEDVPLTLELSDLARQKPDAAACSDLFRELEFSALRKRFGQSEAPREEEAGDVVRTAEQLEALLVALSGAQTVALRVRLEGQGVGAKAVGLALAPSPERGWWVPLADPPATVPQQGQTTLDWSAPGGSAPGGSAPGGTAPGGSAPGGSAPGGTAPGGSAPGGSAPGGSAPGGSAPGGESLEVRAVVAALGAVLGEASRRILGHELKRDLYHLARAGFPLLSVGGDVQLASYLINPSRPEVELSELVQARLGQGLSLPDLGNKAAREAVAIHALDTILEPELVASDLKRLYDEVECPLATVLTACELRGIRLDTAQLRALSEEYAGLIGLSEARIKALAGGDFNPSSPKQLQAILFEKLGLPVTRRTKTGPSTDQEVLEGLAELHPLPEEILAYRSLVKLKNTYIDVLPGLVDPRTGRIHTTYKQTVAATGRLSSVDPNLQNIPVRGEEGKRIRRAFLPAEGWRLLSADYSQIELRLLAHFCEDETLVYAFTHGLDIHAATAADMFGVPLEQVSPEQRRAAKAINFGILYGMGPHRLARELKISRKDAEQRIKRYFERYSRVKGYLEGTLERAREQGFVTTLFQRRRYLPDLKAGNFNARQAAERMAINTPIQGSAADIIKLAMLRVEAALQAGGFRSRMLLQVHDELVFELPPEEEASLTSLVRSEMEGVVKLRIPLTVDVGVGANWAEAH